MTDKNNEIKLTGGDDTLAVNEQAGVYTAAAKSSDSATNTTTRILVRSVTLCESSLTLLKGETQQICATVQPSNATNKNIVWSTQYWRVASVDSEGRITGNEVGATYINAEAADGSGARSACLVSVIPRACCVTINKENLTLKVGEEETLTATVIPEEAPQDIVWESENGNVAIVHEDGRVVARDVGIAKIRAYAKDDYSVDSYVIVEVTEDTSGEYPDVDTDPDVDMDTTTTQTNPLETDNPAEEQPDNNAPEVNQADPIDMSTGAQTLSNNIMKLFGGQSIALTAKYNSTQLCKGELGVGWHHNFEKRVEFLDNEVKVYSSPSCFSKYTADESRTIFTCTTAGKTGYVLTYDCCCEYPYILNCNGERTEYYDLEGRLSKIVDRHGFETYVVSDGSTTQIVDTLNGFSIYLEKNSDGKVIRVHDGTREAILTYQNECLTNICDVNGKMLTFTYDNKGRVLTATDSTGVQYLQNTYDLQGRVSTQRDGAGSPATVIEYNEGGTRTATNRNGDKNYRTFNEQGLLTSFTDENGNTKTYTYDENFNITSETDALGNTETTVYNSFNKPTQKTDKNGNTTRFEYDAVGNLKKIIYPNNAEETFTYNGRNQITEHIDLRGTKTTYTYNEDGRLTSKKVGGRNPSTYVYENGFLVSETNARGYKVKYTYNSIGQMTVKEDHQSRQTKYEYDLAGNVTKITDHEGNSIVYEYDGNYQKKSSTDANGNKTEYEYNGNMKNTQVKLPDGNCVKYEYDNEDRVVKVIDQEGKASSTTYDKAGRVTSKKDPDGHETFYECDAVGRVVKQTNAKGAHTYNTYDAVGNVIETKDNEGNITRFQYDNMSRVVRKVNALSGTTLYEYSPAGDLVKEIDAMGNTKTYTYDAYGNRTQTKDARGNVTKYTYDANNNMLTATDALGNVTGYKYDYRNLLIRVVNPKGYIANFFEYDSLGRRTAVIDGINNKITTTYDANGNVIKVVDAMGNTVSETTYNCLNLPATVKDAFGNTTAYSYNDLGKIDYVTDALSNTKHYRYNNRGLNTSVIDALGNPSTATYDGLGNVTEVEGPNDAVTQYTYDAQGRKISETTSSGGTVQYGYTAMNLKSEFTNARGQNKKFFYDAMGRITGYIGDEDSASYTYDENSNLLTATDKNGTVTREYDALNRVTKYTDTFGNTIQYRYDAAGNLIKLIYPDNTEVTYTYDCNKNLISVTDWFGRTTSYVYDNNNKLVETYYPNGAYNSKGYDKAQRLLSNVTMTPGCVDVIAGTSVTYDELGRISTEHAIEKSEYICYTYDKLSRVTKKDRYGDEEHTELIGTETYTYDAAGNIKTIIGNNQTKNFLYDTNNRLTSCNGEAPSYDADGNMTSAYLGGQTTSFVFDSANRLMSAGENTYTYDVQNTRIRKTHGDEITTFVYNTNTRLSQLLVEKKGDTITKYVYGNGLICSYTGDETTLKVYHYDFRGSTVAITNTLAETTDTFEYDTYGKLISRTGTTQTPFTYNGRDGVYSDENGLIYMRARYYSPELRRFVNADILHGDITDSTSLNRYAYVNGNPVSFVDPLGMAKEERSGGRNVLSEIANRKKLIKEFMEKNKGDGTYIISADGIVASPIPPTYDFEDYYVAFGKEVDKILKTVWATINSIGVEAGIGLGLRGSVDVGYGVTGGFKSDLIHLSIGKGELFFGQKEVSGMNVGSGIFSVGTEKSSSHPYFGHDCQLPEGICIGHEILDDCPATEVEEGPTSSISVGVEGYVFIGAEAGFSFDLDYWLEEMYEIWF